MGVVEVRLFLRALGQVVEPLFRYAKFFFGDRVEIKLMRRSMPDDNRPRGADGVEVRFQLFKGILVAAFPVAETRNRRTAEVFLEALIPIDVKGENTIVLLPELLDSQLLALQHLR